MSDNWDWTTEVILPSRRGAHQPLMEEILQELEKRGWNGRDYFGVQMALEESLTNAIRHGNKLDESKQVSVECKLSDTNFWMRVEDQGEGFIPADVADCTIDACLERHGGRGMLLIKSYMTRVEHNERGNCITMHKTREEASSSNTPK